MNKFHEYVQSVYENNGDDWFNQRMKQFQAAASGQKGAIEGQPQNKPLAIINTSRILTNDEVKKLGLHPNHNLVWQGSTADAPTVYPYVYLRAKRMFVSNPRYRG